MSTVEDSFMALYSIDTPIDSMLNDVMIELECALDEFVSQKDSQN